MPQRATRRSPPDSPIRTGMKVRVERQGVVARGRVEEVRPSRGKTATRYAVRLADGRLLIAKRAEIERTPRLRYGPWRGRVTRRTAAVIATLAAAVTVLGFVIDRGKQLLPKPPPPVVSDSVFDVYNYDRAKQWVKDAVVHNGDRLWFAVCLCTTNRGLSHQTVAFYRAGPASATETITASFGAALPLQVVLRSSSGSPIRLVIFRSTPQLTDRSGHLLERLPKAAPPALGRAAHAIAAWNAGPLGSSEQSFVMFAAYVVSR